MISELVNECPDSSVGAKGTERGLCSGEMPMNVYLFSFYCINSNWNSSGPPTWYFTFWDWPPMGNTPRFVRVFCYTVHWESFNSSLW